MANNTTTNLGLNSVLLFGDFGTEVIRLSQLYDPKNDKIQPVSFNKPRSTDTYYTATFADRTIKFTHVAYSDLNLNTDGTFAETYYYDTGLTETSAGKYVPVPQTLVVVDLEDSMNTTRWGTYTLLVVDKVYDGTVENDPVYAAMSATERASYIPTYESVLVPINFTGGVDVATRAVDYANDQMMLYVENVLVGSTSVQRIVPDRKLLMYGSKSLKYVIKRVINGEEVIICTDAVTTGHAILPQMIDYLTASGIKEGANTRVGTKAEFEALAGKTISYTDGNGVKHTTSVVIEKEDGEYTESTQDLFEELCAVYDRAESILVYSDSQNILNNVQLPNACYLRTDMTAIASGETLTFEVYEAEKVNNVDVYNRLVLAVKVNARVGTMLSDADLTGKVITKFDVELNGNDAGDLWQITKATNYNDLSYSPYLTFEDGEKRYIDKTADKAFYVFGIERLSSAIVGEEFDVLFKYFPNRMTGRKSTTGIDNRYIPATETTPSPLKQYLVKDANGNFSLAGSNKGYLTSFETGKTYYTQASKLSWNQATVHPTRDMMVCRKRIRVVAATGDQLRKICVIPWWNAEYSRYDIKFLAYLNDYKSPNLITTTNAEGGSIVISGGMPNYSTDIKRVIMNLTAYYKPGINTAYWPTGKNLAIMLDHFQNKKGEFGTGGDEAWLIGQGEQDLFADQTHIPYGRHSESFNCRRPYLYCQKITEDNGTTYNQYWVPVDATGGFPNYSNVAGGINWFLAMFYERALIDSDASWAYANSEAKTLSLEPTHFRVRSMTDNGVATGYMPMYTWDATTGEIVYDADSSKSGYMTYRTPFVLEGLPVPTKLLDAEVIVEFVRLENNQWMHLLGVPVEVKLYE